jgi:hypothetical protein
MVRLVHSYAPKKHTVPAKDPTNAGCTPPYNPFLKPSCRHIVEYVLPMDVYLGGIWGSPCCRVFTVSRECISMSPVVPPMPPASIACRWSIGVPHLCRRGILTCRYGGRAASSSISSASAALRRVSSMGSSIACAVFATCPLLLSTSLCVESPFVKKLATRASTICSIEVRMPILWKQHKNVEVKTDAQGYNE